MTDSKPHEYLKWSEIKTGDVCLFCALSIFVLYILTFSICLVYFNIFYKRSGREEGGLIVGKVFIPIHLYEKTCNILWNGTNEDIALK